MIEEVEALTTPPTADVIETLVTDEKPVVVESDKKNKKLKLLKKLANILGEDEIEALLGDD